MCGSSTIGLANGKRRDKLWAKIVNVLELQKNTKFRARTRHNEPALIRGHLFLAAPDTHSTQKVRSSAAGVVGQEAT